MTRNIRRAAARGFTLIEILIVVVILGILAAIIIPQFTNAANSANVASARTQLQTMRSQIELFRSQLKVYPGTGAVGQIAAGTWLVQLEDAGYIRDATDPWANDPGFTPDYVPATGTLSLALSVGTGYDTDNDLDSDADDITAVAAW